MRFAQILNNRVHWIFESNEKPEFAPYIIIVELDGHDEVQEGWAYIDGVFFETDNPINEAEQESANEAAKLLILNKLIADAAQTLDFTAEEYATLALSNNIFPEWEEGATYSAGTRVVYTPPAAALSAGAGGRAIYEVTADTVATAEKTPDTDTEAYTALYALASGSVEIAEGSETAEADGGGEGNNANDSAAQIFALNAKIDELTEALSELQNKTQD